MNNFKKLATFSLMVGTVLMSGCDTEGQTIRQKGIDACIKKGCSTNEMIEHVQIYAETYKRERDAVHRLRDGKNMNKTIFDLVRRSDKSYGEKRADEKLKELHEQGK